MKHYLRIHRTKKKPKGTSLAVAMFIIIALTGIGIIALNSASYELASSGAFRQGADAESVAEGGLALARCEMCQSIDAIVLAMQSMRQTRGQSPEFSLDRDTLEHGLTDDETTFAEPDPTEGRGSFGNLYDPLNPVTPPTINVSIDRPRETNTIAGYSLRESAGSDSSSFCFRNYRVTSDGTYTPVGGGLGTRAKQRAFIVAGPIQCTN